jgi:nucleotide-binding universal stress UspA family protein
MVPIRHILVATDFSDSACAALDFGTALAGRFNAKLHVLHVVSEPLHQVWAGYIPASEFMETIEQLQVDARKHLEQWVPRGALASSHVIVATAWGEPRDQIVKYAKDHHVDLIVCGTHGRRGWNHLLMGSVAEGVVRLAPCPVLTVHASTTPSAAA